MTFYGVSNDDQWKLMELSNEIIEIYKRNGRTAVQIDNMLLAMRTMSFMNEVPFNEAIQQYCCSPEGGVIVDNMTKFWRLHIYTWCCSQAMRLQGDLVECGVHLGLYSLVMMKTLNFGETGKKMYLYDTFEGLADNLSTQNERAVVGETYSIPDWEKQVRESFSKYPLATVVKGKVPEILHECAPESVSFLHLDMNTALAEAYALEFFQTRLVDGAIILLDDFGRTEFPEINSAHCDMFGKLGRRILELPTGQGIVIWN